MTSHAEILGAFAGLFPKAFAPCAYYDHDGDCIEFFAASDPFRAERLDQWVTVYRSETTDEIVGSQIKQVRALLEKSPGLDIEIEGDEVCITHLLRARAWNSGDAVARKTYKVLISKADGVKVELKSVA